MNCDGGESLGPVEGLYIGVTEAGIACCDLQCWVAF